MYNIFYNENSSEEGLFSNLYLTLKEKKFSDVQKKRVIVIAGPTAVGKTNLSIAIAQIIGGEEVTQRINALSFAIQKHMTVRELAKADTAYAPPLCETWEPIVLAAEIALRKLR